MFFFDKKQVTISLKYLGGHPEMPKQRILTVFKGSGTIQFKEINHPVIPVQTIKKITLCKAENGPGAPGSFSTGRTPAPGAREIKAMPCGKNINNVLVVTLDYNGLDVYMYFTGSHITAKYAQFMGLLKGNYKEYLQSENCSST